MLRRQLRCLSMEPVSLLPSASLTKSENASSAYKEEMPTPILFKFKRPRKQASRYLKSTYQTQPATFQLQGRSCIFTSKLPQSPLSKLSSPTSKSSLWSSNISHVQSVLNRLSAPTPSSSSPSPTPTCLLELWSLCGGSDVAQIRLALYLLRTPQRQLR